MVVSSNLRCPGTWAHDLDLELDQDVDLAELDQVLGLTTSTLNCSSCRAMYAEMTRKQI